MQHRATFFSVILGVSILLSACVDKFTAGGTLPSAEGSGVANFGLVINLEKDHASGTYRDDSAGVSLRIVDLIQGGQTSPNCIDVNLAYVSTNPAQRGEGEVRISLCDFGEPGTLEGDNIAIGVSSGPFAGYSNERQIRSGNNQAHN